MLPKNQPLPLMQTTWATQLDPIIANPIVNGVQLVNIAVISGDNNVNHRLGRKPQGYIVTGMHSVFAEIYDKPSPFPELFLILNASAQTTVDIYVY